MKPSSNKDWNCNMPKKKVELDLVAAVVGRHAKDKAKGIIDDLIAQLNQMADEEKPEREKRQFAILVSDPYDTLKGRDLVGWVLQIPEGKSPATIPQMVKDVGNVFAATPKGRRAPPRSIGEVMEIVPAKIFKEQGVVVNTKTPVLLIPTDNNLT